MSSARRGAQARKKVASASKDASRRSAAALERASLLGTSVCFHTTWRASPLDKVSVTSSTVACPSLPHGLDASALVTLVTVAPPVRDSGSAGRPASAPAVALVGPPAEDLGAIAKLQFARGAKR